MDSTLSDNQRSLVQKLVSGLMALSTPRQVKNKLFFLRPTKECSCPLCSSYYKAASVPVTSVQAEEDNFCFKFMPFVILTRTAPVQMARYIYECFSGQVMPYFQAGITFTV